jgi:hypothetical protein
MSVTNSNPITTTGEIPGAIVAGRSDGWGAFAISARERAANTPSIAVPEW